MLSVNEQIRYVEKAIDAECYEYLDDPQDNGRIILRLRNGDKLFRFNVERRRLREAAEGKAQGFIDLMRSMLHRKSTPDQGGDEQKEVRIQE
jgi:hypothetical protein